MRPRPTVNPTKAPSHSGLVGDRSTTKNQAILF